MNTIARTAAGLVPSLLIWSMLACVAEASEDTTVTISQPVAQTNAKAKALFRDWIKSHPGTPQAKFESFAKAHPKAAAELLADEEWMERHQEAVEASLQNVDFIVANPEVKTVLLKNDWYVKKYPNVVKKVYTANRVWADKHRVTVKKTSLKKRPAPAKKVYRANHPRRTARPATLVEAGDGSHDSPGCSEKEGGRTCVRPPSSCGVGSKTVQDSLRGLLFYGLFNLPGQE